MRLISVHDFGLKEFIGQKIPLYAILSHTWGNNEVSFQDIQHLESAKKKEGFKKIEYCCEQAKADGLQWFWVDTCCIDKTSSAELSEAINSMFQWYSQALICYVYLSDVNLNHGIMFSNFALMDFQRSRWFTRGWTLQELLAPLTVKFYSASWTFLGLKKELAPIISVATGIPTKILDHSAPVLEQTVYERLHWASKRNTTRTEDMAYCLLGLFDINLPLLYGEGKRSFQRLQEEILKQLGDHTLFLWDLHPEKGLPEDEDEQMLVAKIGIYSGILAESPEQFGNTCNVKEVATAKSRDPVLFGRKGTQLNLYLKRTYPKSIVSWPSFVTDQEAHEDEFYLAALYCNVMDERYVSTTSLSTVDGRGEKCTAMLLLRHSGGEYYERVLSYYETVDLKDVITSWKYESCFIGNPTTQHMISLRRRLTNNVKLRWSNPAIRYKLKETFIDDNLTIFLLAEYPSSAKPHLIIICATRPHRAILEARFERLESIRSEHMIQLIAAKYRSQKGDIIKAGTGPVLEKSVNFLHPEKDLVLTLIAEEAFNSPLAAYSGRAWTIWLSFRQAKESLINETVLKGIEDL